MTSLTSTVAYACGCFQAKTGAPDQCPVHHRPKTSLKQLAKAEAEVTTRPDRESRGMPLKAADCAKEVFRSPNNGSHRIEVSGGGVIICTENGNPSLALKSVLLAVAGEALNSFTAKELLEPAVTPHNRATVHPACPGEATCQRKLMEAGKAYPHPCHECGVFGPCRYGMTNGPAFPEPTKAENAEIFLGRKLPFRSVGPCIVDAENKTFITCLNNETAAQVCFVLNYSAMMVDE
jgi:hypothetical protein